MRKVLALILVLSTLNIGGCTEGGDFKIQSKDFTKSQQEILSLSGERACKYVLKNLPKDESYELDVVYEVYKNKEKIKEETIWGMSCEPTTDKVDNITMAINIQENKIRMLSDGSYSDLDIEEDIPKLTNYYFAGNRKIDIGDEVYLFHGNKGGKCVTAKELGTISKGKLDELIENNEVNVFVKLVCK